MHKYLMSEVLSSLHTCFFYAKDAWAPYYTYWDKGSMYIRNHSEKNMSDSDFRALLYASYSVSYYMTNTSVFQMITTCIVLPVDTLEGNWVEKKRQHSPSNINLSIPFGERASLMLFPWVGNLPVFHATWNFLIKSVQNLVLNWMVLLGGFYDEY